MVGEHLHSSSSYWTALPAPVSLHHLVCTLALELDLVSRRFLVDGYRKDGLVEK